MGAPLQALAAGRVLFSAPVDLEGKSGVQTVAEVVFLGPAEGLVIEVEGHRWGEAWRVVALETRHALGRSVSERIPVAGVTHVRQRCSVLGKGTVLFSAGLSLW